MAKHEGKPVVWVTGGAGYIGANVVRELIWRGMQPIVVDDLSSGSKLLLPPKVPLVEVELYDAKSLEESLTEVVVTYGAPRVVIHLAAEKRAGVCEADPEMAYQQNVLTLWNIMSLANHYGVNPHVVFASSSAVYGNPARRVARVVGAYTEPESIYGKSKLSAENLIKDFFPKNRATILRLFNVAGAWLHPTLNVGPKGSPYSTSPALFPAFAAAYISQKEFTFRAFSHFYCGQSPMVRDFIHVSDVAKIFAEVASDDIYGTTGVAEFKIHNVGRGIPIETTELLKLTKYKKTDIAALINFELVKSGSEIAYSLAAEPYKLKSEKFKTLGQMWADEVRWQGSKLFRAIKSDITKESE